MDHSSIIIFASGLVLFGLALDLVIRGYGKRRSKANAAIAKANISEVQPPRPPDPPDMAHTEEMLQQVNRQMEEAMRGMDARLGQAMQQASVSVERAMENMAQVMANSRLRGRTGETARHDGNLVVSGDLTVRGGNITITHGEGEGGDVVIRAGNARGIQQEIRLGLPSGGVSVTRVQVPPEPPKPPVEEKLPPTIYERLNQDDD